VAFAKQYIGSLRLNSYMIAAKYLWISFAISMKNPTNLLILISKTNLGEI